MVLRYYDGLSNPRSNANFSGGTTPAPDPTFKYHVGVPTNMNLDLRELAMVRDAMEEIKSDDSRSQFDRETAAAVQGKAEGELEYIAESRNLGSDERRYAKQQLS